MSHDTCEEPAKQDELRPRLFHPTFYSYNDMGRALSKEIESRIKELIKNTMRDYDPVDVEMILMETASIICAEIRLDMQAELTRQSRKTARKEESHVL